ncbi:MAG: glycosyl hydrolase [Pseudomonadota bacterium]
MFSTMNRRTLARMLAATAALPSLSRANQPIAPPRSREQLASQAPLLGVYVGNDPEDLVAFESWLGRRVDGISLHTGDADRFDWRGSIPWLAERWKDVDRGQFWSIPLIPEGATLEEAAAGDYDEDFSTAATALSRRGLDDIIHVRTGWEFNGDWMTWSAIGKAELYNTAFRRFVDRFREHADRFVFEWCPNYGDQGMNPELAYPGDDYVDVIGMDFYYDPRWDSADPNEAWVSMVDRPYGLKWHQEFAASRGKPTSYAEWGVTLPTAAPYIEAAARWFEDHPVHYQCYWDSDDDFRGKLSAGRLPEVASMYQRAFR